MPGPAELIGDLQATVEDALARAGYTATSWLIVASVINHDGSETLIRQSSDGLPVWIRSGMLTEALSGWDKDEQEETDG